MKKKIGLRLVSLVMLLSWCSWVKAAEVKFPIDGDAWTEETAGWGIRAYNAGCNPKYSLSYDKENKKKGKASLKVNYLFPKKDGSYVNIIKQFEKPIDISNFDVVKCWVFNPAAGRIYLSFYLFAFDMEDSRKVVYRTWRMSLKTGWNEVTYKIDEYGSQSPKKEPEAFDKKSLKRIEFYVHNSLSSGVVANQENYILIDGLHFEKTSIGLAEISNIKETSISTAEIPKILFAPKVKVSPKIDGKLNDLCWEKADKATDFILTSGSSAKKQTTTYLAYDDKNLYIAFECQEPDITKLTKKVKVRDSGVLWKDDCIEIFLRPEDDYFHFILNTLNTQFD
ncbi:hypothetical protein KAW50_08515, partial [candidate division WOR-3 bacterium]|nr:hypothetical protein [candidate division WOR-3 bacterium]